MRIFAPLIALVAIIFFFGSLLVTGRNSGNGSKSADTVKISPEKAVSQYEVFAENLEVPWDMEFLPDGRMLVTERPGRVRITGKDGSLSPNPVAVIDVSSPRGSEGGLLGMDLHPAFDTNGYVYLYYTYSTDNGNTKNRVVRMKFSEDRLKDEEIIIEGIPGAMFHNGGRVSFGPDGYLYVTTGDSQEPSLAQDRNSLAGKILRVTDDGKPAPGNPFGNEVLSYGHRNPQGLA